MHENIKTILKNLPSSPGIYQFLNASGEIIYIGKSVHLKNRVNSYFNGTTKLNFAKRKMVEQIVDVHPIVTNNETESLILENTLIKKHQPKYNILLKDDKNYLYIKVTDETFPKIIKTRIKGKTGTYYGPYINGPYVVNILRIAKKIFGYGCYGINFFRTGNEYNLDKYIFKNNKSEKDYVTSEQIERLYKEKIKEIQSFLKGDTQSLIENLENRMKSFASELKFEEAGKIKYDIDSLKMIEEHQIVRDMVSGDFDVINILEKYGKYYVGCIEIRASKITGFFHYEIHSNLEESQEEILTNFIEQRFAENYEQRKPVFITPFKLPEIAAGIQIEVPQKGGKLDTLKLCYKNVYEYAHKKHLASLSTKSFTKKTMKEILEMLEYEEKNKNIIFECNDISHLSGTHTVASRSIIENGKKNPSKYKKFNIKTLKEGKIDDFGSMKEIMERRLKELLKLKNLPDLIIIDGGKGQLSSVMSIIKSFQKGLSEEEKTYIQELQIVSLAKREEELFLPKKRHPEGSEGSSEPALHNTQNMDSSAKASEGHNTTFKKITLKKDSDHLRLIQSIRDEAHRFAITFNRDKRNTSMKKSILDSIPGIGPVTKKKIIKNFGSLEKLKEHKKKDVQTVLGNNITEILENHGFVG